MVYNYAVFAAALINNCERCCAKMSNEQEKKIWIITMQYSTKSHFVSIFHNNKIFIFLQCVMIGRNGCACKQKVF